MLLRLSRFVHLIPLAGDRVLLVDAIRDVRLVVTRQAAGLIQSFERPVALKPEIAQDRAAMEALGALMERGILTEATPEAELARAGEQFGQYHGRDPLALLERFRRQAKEGAELYYAVGAALDVADFSTARPQVQLLLFGDCDVQMESDFLRREAAGRGIDLKVAPTASDDVRFAGEHKHDVILIGALRSRETILEAGEPPHAAFLAEARGIIAGLRQHSAAPILIDNLPEPMVQPLGLAERGALGHRNRFRAANIALAELVESYPDVHVVDVAATLAAAGAERLLDDGQFGFSHFGSPGWMLQRPEKEKSAVHGIFPDLAPLAAFVGGDPYGREAVLARAHVDVLAAVLGMDRKKCVIVDLDGVLWPGVLAETGSPFAWEAGDSPYSYIGLYFGIHEALKALKRRGILLACVSKNDEATVRALWRYDEHYPKDLLLTPDDFVSWRVNWNDKADNIRELAGELGLALESFLFIDDNPVERERVRQFLPQVEVWGEELFGLRRKLLNDPRLQVPRLTGEAATRTASTKAQLTRQAARGDRNEADFLASLDVQTRIGHAGAAELQRVSELFQRTTQFNTNGAKFPVAELEALLRQPDAAIFTLHVKDRFGDHGLAGAAVIQRGEITGLVLSCRVLGLGVEHRFLQHIMRDHPRLTGRIIPTDRNNPVRNLFSDNGFALESGIWRKT